MLDELTLNDVRATTVSTVMGVMSLFWGTSLETPAVTPMPKDLTSRDVGDYALWPWQEPGTAIEPNSPWDRIRDLNFVVGKERLTDTLSDEIIEKWTDLSTWGAASQKKLLLQLYFWDGTDRFQGTLEPIDVYWNRLQLFLDAMQARNLLPYFVGIVLAEENVWYSGRAQVLTTLYQRIKAKYDVAVFQWYSPTQWIPSSGGWIPADGWVIDNYLVGNPQFRQYVRKYVVTRTPVVVMPWATSDAAARPPLTADQWKANNEQLDVALEFNLPVAFYWTKDGTTYFGADRNNPTNDEIGLMNQWVWNFITRVQALPANYAGLPSADTGTAAVLNTSGYVGSSGALQYRDDFSTQKCLDDASITGFRDLVMNGQTLSTFGYQGRNVNTVITYQFQGTAPLKYPAASVMANIASTTGNRIQLAISPDGKTWSTITSQKAGSATLTLSTNTSSSTSRQFARLTSFWVRITLTGAPGSNGQPSVGIDNLYIAAVKASR